MLSLQLLLTLLLLLLLPLILNLFFLFSVLFLVSQIFLLKTKLFQKSARLHANICTPLLLKCRPSLHKQSLVTLPLLTKRKLFLSHFSHKHSLSCIMICVNFSYFLTKIDENIASLTR